MLQTLVNILIETLWLMLYLAIGIIVGILIFILVEAIVKLVAKHKRKELYTIVVDSALDLDLLKKDLQVEFVNSFGKAKLSKRIKGLKEISLKGINTVAKSLYPESSKPIYEITIDNLFTLGSDLTKKIDHDLDEILGSNAFKLLWGSYATINRIKNLFTKNKENEVNYDIRKQKLSYIKKVIDNKKPKDDKPKSDKDKSYFLVNDLINNKISSYISYAVDEAYSLYRERIVSVKKVD